MPHADPVARRAYMRDYKRLHPEKFGQDYDRVRHANRRAARYGVTGRITIADVRAAKASGRCHYCGATSGTGAFTDLGIDHRIPLHLGGPNERANLVPCCHICNVRKWRKLEGEWAAGHRHCRGCGGTGRPHVARGFCSPCYQSDRKRR